MKKMKIAILFGGKSGEHEVSIMSASNVVKAIDGSLFTVKLVYVDKKGVFWQVDGVAGLKNKRLLEQDFWKKVEVAFPVMHGPNCEDGSMQGFLRTVGVHCVGPGVLGSALGMDKDVQKQLLRFNGIKVTDWLLVRDYEFSEEKLKEIKTRIKKDFQYPVFVKPVNMGSSVGISKVKNDRELKSKIEEAFKFDNKVLIEKAVVGREVECAVLGDLPEVVVSAVGEVVSQNGHEFYDYKAKYFDEKGAQILVPAPNINLKKVAEIQA
jgi:D-alanine-D-alanine ligase